MFGKLARLPFITNRFSINIMKVKVKVFKKIYDKHAIWSKNTRIFRACFAREYSGNFTLIILKHWLFAIEHSKEYTLHIQNNFRLQGWLNLYMRQIITYRLNVVKVPTFKNWYNNTLRLPKCKLTYNYILKYHLNNVVCTAN